MRTFRIRGFVTETKNSLSRRWRQIKIKNARDWRAFLGRNVSQSELWRIHFTTQNGQYTRATAGLTQAMSRQRSLRFLLRSAGRDFTAISKAARALITIARPETIAKKTGHCPPSRFSQASSSTM